MSSGEFRALASDVALAHPALDAAGIEAINPQRGPLRQLDGVLAWTTDPDGALAYKDVSEDEFWVPHHIPGRPLMPAVLMIEAAAQLSALLGARLHPEIGFIGLAGVRGARFAREVTIGDRLVLIARLVDGNPRLLRCAVEGEVEGRHIFSAEIIGVPLPPAR